MLKENYHAVLPKLQRNALSRVVDDVEFGTVDPKVTWLWPIVLPIAINFCFLITNRKMLASFNMLNIDLLLTSDQIITEDGDKSIRTRWARHNVQVTDSLLHHNY